MTLTACRNHLIYGLYVESRKLKIDAGQQAGIDAVLQKLQSPE